MNEATDDKQHPDATDTMRTYRPINETDDRTTDDNDETQQVPLPQFC